MTAFLLPVLAALFLWWAGTGAVFWLARSGLGRGATFRLATLLLAVAAWGIWALRDDTSLTACYLSFAGGIVAWGWIETGFLTGHVTGPVKRSCPPGLVGPRRFALALGTILWQELAILGLGATLLALVLDGANQVGAWVFVLLGLLRVSAKLNLFLGVPYPPDALLPAHLAHLGSFFRRSAPSALMPAAITLATALATLVAWRAADPALDAFHASFYMLLWTLLVLGIAEHWFLILPVHETRAWRLLMEPIAPPEARVTSSAICSESRRGGYIPPKSSDREGLPGRKAPGLAPLQPTVQGGTR